jgi:universal stress protein F
MYKHILVAVALDTAHNAEQSLRIAKVLASDDTRTTVLNVKEVIPAYVMTYLPENHDAGLKEELMTKLNDLASQIDNGVGVLVEGHSGHSILDWASDNNVDCIIIASHRPGLQDYLLGSTAARVVRHAQCSVHVIR